MQSASFPGLEIVNVVSSEGAVGFFTTKGDVFLLYNYEVKKIMTKYVYICIFCNAVNFVMFYLF